MWRLWLAVRSACLLLGSAYAFTPKFTVCATNGEYFYTFPEDACPRGVFLKEPLPAGCICISGTWVLHQTLCDLSAIIFHGDGFNHNCFKVNFNISLVQYLGDPNNGSYSKSYVAPHSLTVFHELKEGETPLLDYHWPSLIVINPKPQQGVQVQTQGSPEKLCYHKKDTHPSHMTIAGYIWDTAIGPSTYKVVDTCPMKRSKSEGYSDFIGSYPDFFYRSNIPMDDPIEVGMKECHKPCTEKLRKGIKRKTGPVVGLRITRRKRQSQHFLNSTLPGLNLSFEQGPIRRRRKRYRPRDRLESVWDGLGFCMTSYWDPILKFQMETKEENWCYPPQTRSSRQ